ncbi:chromosome partitioning protein [Micromonospora maritima]|uniref:MinD/ParA family ATP-binding protein n=1 Tax=Micromonospora maritima TaxID=986711 RepID=UPI0031EEE199
MVHENDDRAHVPGRPQVPERDVEPLWPPEETDGVVTAPPWAAPVQPNMPWPLPPGVVPPPVVPAPDPTHPTVPAPRPGGPGAGTTHPVPPAVPAPDPTHQAPQPAVDLDLPFTLDQPALGSPPAPHIEAPPAPHIEAPPAPHIEAPPAPHVEAPTTATSASPTGPGSPAAPRTWSAGPTPTPGADGDAIGSARAESPWAQPPQRTAPETADPTALPNGATGTGPASDGPGPGGPFAPGPAHPGPVGPGPQSTGPVGPGPQSTGPVGPGPEDTGPVSAGPVGPAHPGPVSAGPVDAGPASGSAPVPSSSPGGPAEEAPPRLGPFPPSPGVPMQQPPYGNGTAYPPPAYPPQPGQPGWYPPGWPQQTAPPHQTAAPHQSATPQTPAPHQAAAPHQAGPAQPPQSAPPGPHVTPPYPEQGWTPQQAAPPTAEDFARRRQARPVDPVATMGVRAVVNRMGLVRLAPGRHEQEVKRDIEMVRRNFGGLRQVTVVNPKGGAGKTVAILLLAMTFGQKRGGYVLAWDNNETQGTLGMRAQQDFHARTVRDMLRDLAQFQGPHGRVGDLSQYVRSQGEGMFDVLASDESATGGEMLTAAAFAEIREVVSRFYKLIFVDTGNNVRAQNWQAAMDATDQLVVTMSARNDSAETAARMLDHLEQSGRQRLVRQAVTVVSMPPSRKEIDLPAIQAHFAARTRAVLLAPYERLIDTGEPLRYGQLSSATRDAWLKIAASVAEGL